MLGTIKNGRFLKKNKLEYTISWFKKIHEYEANHPVALTGLADSLESLRKSEEEGEKKRSSRLSTLQSKSWHK
ncbi:MAG: hypothetical protein WA631_18810 [Nitrososphaeraceae archaeon]